MRKVRSDRMIFTAILDKAAKSACRFQVAGFHSGSTFHTRMAAAAPGENRCSAPLRASRVGDCRGNSSSCIALLLEVGVKRARMSTNGYGGLQSGADGRKVVTRDGEPGMSYISQEAAYEVAVAEASGDLRTGHEIRIEVVGDAYDRAGGGSPTLSPTSPQE
jgi:hypothetical protein